jgi:tRNA dimethylallyltransferase
MNSRIIDFLKNNHENKIIVIYGPTACGKTAFSVELAKQLDTEIISADSRQIYRYLDIGTGKITEAEKRGITHHMLDILEPDEDYSVGEYKKTVLPIIESLHKK